LWQHQSGNQWPPGLWIGLIKLPNSFKLW
jgi:hypothetical protein